MPNIFGRVSPDGTALIEHPLDLRAAYPAIGFPPEEFMGEHNIEPFMADEGVVFVRPMSPPIEPGMVAVPAPPELVDGEWRAAWTLVPVASPTFEQRAAMLRDAVQTHMDDRARALGYDDVRTAVTYAEEPAVPKFQAEGRAFRTWRSRVWAFCYWLLDEVSAGRALEPTPSALFAVLPTLELPE